MEMSNDEATPQTPEIQMRKSEANKISDAQLNIWADSNRDPGTMPCIPVILINTLAGDKPGIVLNLAKGMSMEIALKFLMAATEQVQKQMEVETN